MCKGGGTTTNTTNTAPPPEVMEAYRDLMGRSQAVADTPYQPYGGDTYRDSWSGFLPGAYSLTQKMAAPVTGQLPTVAAANMNPFAAQAADYGTGNGLDISNFASRFAAAGPQTQAFSPAAIQQYMSPYTQNVIDATSAQFAHDNAVQGNSLLGTAIRSGNAFGGDRAGVAQAELAGTQKRAQDPVIAGLYNNAYTQALGQFNTNNTQAAQNAGLGIQGMSTGANLGLGGLNLGAQGYGQAQQLALTGLSSDASRAGQAGQEIAGLGQVTQANTQAGLDAAYQQFLLEKAYPFATTSFLAQNLLGTGSQMGGTSTSTSTPPRPAFSFLAHGGRVPRFAAGGGLGSGVPWITLNGTQLPMGRGLPSAQAPNIPQPTKIGTGDTIAAAKGANELYKAAKSSDLFSGVPSPMGEGFAPIQDVGNLSYGYGPELPGFYAGAGDGMGAMAGLGGASEAAGLGAGAEMGLGAGLGAELGAAGAGIMEALPFLAMLNRGGAIPRRAHGGRAVAVHPRFARGGGLGMATMPRRYANGGFAMADDNGIGSMMRQVEQVATALGAMPGRASGGMVMPSAMPMGFADGGMPDVEMVDPDQFNRFDARAGQPTMDYSDATSPNWQVARAFQDLQAGDGPTFAPPSASVPPTMTAMNMPMPPPRPMGLGDGSMPPLFARIAQDAPQLPASAMGFDDPSNGRGLTVPESPVSAYAPTEPEPRGLSPAVSDQRQPSRLGREPNGLDQFLDSPWSALATGVLGALASRSPYASVAIGEGALTGLSAYGAARKMSQDAEKIRADLERQDAAQRETAQHHRSLEEAQRFTNQRLIEQSRETQADRKQRIAETERYHNILDKQRTDAQADRMTRTGYAKNPDGTLSPIKGGPADPEQIAIVTKAKQTGGVLSDDTADFLAERILAGDSKALVGLGRGAQGAENITNVQTRVARMAAERGLNPSDILAKVAEQSGFSASQRTFGTQTAKMAINSTEAEGAIQQGLEVSKNVPRTKFVPVNKLVQMAEANISDPDLLEFRAANLAIINTYARAISPTGVPTVHDKEEAMKVVSEATSPDAYQRVMKRMLKEIEIAHAAPTKAKAELERIRKSGTSDSSQSGSTAAPSDGTAATKPTVKTKKEYDALKSGTEFIGSDGKPYQKP